MTKRDVRMALGAAAMVLVIQLLRSDFIKLSSVKKQEQDIPTFFNLLESDDFIEAYRLAAEDNVVKDTITAQLGDTISISTWEITPKSWELATVDGKEQLKVWCQVTNTAAYSKHFLDPLEIMTPLVDKNPHVYSLLCKDGRLAGIPLPYYSTENGILNGQSIESSRTRQGYVLFSLESSFVADDGTFWAIVIADESSRYEIALS